ncbi:protein mono-ADP-ribosyltransferase PARP14-like isoform X2 [Mercenaria mercenaria]|uniref:protein mono-ADP-ribosyltransferase PARP14-like isoform X2 n=1 Tax=Mercenaria mercenaria TaxID=6596 RepID=UPI00234EC157|nr:protein mono-ADP-ribosyltransferase PARP14-like isoform X2 [Mercenaria mercenaria]
MYFESEKRSCGGNIVDCKFDSGMKMALITFEREEVAKRVEERGNHVVNKETLTVRLHTPDDKSKRLDKPEETVEDKPETSRTIKVKGVDKSVSRDTVELYFENTKRSGGGDIESIQSDEEEEDVLFITFKDKQDADKVVKTGHHKVEGKALSVSIYVPPVPPPSYENKILIKGLKPTTTQDCLFNFIEAKTGYNPETMDCHAEQEDIVMVTFTDKPVIDSVIDRKHVLGKKQLDLKRYQECLGRPEGEVVERKLNVPDPLKMKDVCPHKLKFLKQSKLYREALEKQMLSSHARVVLPTDGGDVTFECTLTRDVQNCFKLVKTWKKETEESFDHFMNAITVCQIIVLQDIWDKVMEQLKSVSVPSPEAVAVCTDRNGGLVTVVGNRQPAESLAKNIREILQKVIEEAEMERQKVTETYKSLKPIEARMLLVDKFPTRMEEIYPEMKVKINHTKHEIVFEGSRGNVSDAKLKMHEIKSDFAKRSIENITTFSAGLFKATQTKDYIVKKMKDESVIGVWEIHEQTLIIFSSSEKTIDHCVSIIRQSVIETSIALTKASASVMNSEAWQYKVKEWHSQYAGTAHIAVDDSMTNVKLCSTDNIANELLLSVKKFLRCNTVLEENVLCTKSLQRLIEKNHKSEISEICKTLQSYHVKITTDEHSGYKICGTEDGMTRSKESLRVLFDKVKRKDHTVIKPGLAEHMKTSRGKDSLDTIESIMPCVISIKVELGEEQMSSNLYGIDPASNGNKNRKIKEKATCKAYRNKIVHTAVGDMTEMKAQVLVNAADKTLSLSRGLGKAMVLKGGEEIEKACQDYIQTEGKLYEGEAFICTAGNLNADYIVHVLGPVWRGGHYNEKKALKEAVLKCMHQASTYRATSMAIPAIGCGSYGYPVKHATSTIVKAISKFFRENHDSRLADIYLCDVKSDTVDFFNEALKEEFGNIHIQEESEDEDYDIQEESEDEDYETFSDRSQVSDYQRAPPVPKSRPSKRKPGSDSNPVNIGNVSIVLKKEEIAKEKVDVIVNTTAKNLDLKNGAVSSSLLKFGGQNLQVEVSTNYPDGINFGEIAVSAGHNLKCSQVFHTTLSNYDANNATACCDALHKLVTSCLAEAQRQNQTSIAFPAIGTGNLGFPKDIVAREMFKAVSKFSAANPNPSVKDVRFIVYQKDLTTIKAFEAEQARWSSGEYKSARQSRKIDPIYERLQSRKTDSGVDSEHEYDFLPDSGESAYVNLKVTVKQGDITKEDSDCIVNSSNETFDLNRGAVSKALLKRGGAALAKEIKSKRDIMRKNHLVWTSAHGIPCKHIVHVVAQDNNKGWKSIIERCLHGAEKKKLKSITFPALGTGFQSDPKEMADVMTCAFVDFDKTKPAFLQDVRIVVFQQGMVQDFKRVLLTDAKQGSGILNAIYNGVKEFFGGGKDGSYAEVSKGTKRKPENRDSVTFEILSMNKNVIQEAIKRLEGCLEKEIHQKELKESVICRMDPNYIAEIEAIARENNVQINTDVKSGKIKIAGLAQNLMNASDKIHGIIRDAVSQEKQRETAEIMSCLVQWFYIDITEECGQKLVEYDKTLNFKIENAFKLQEPTYSFIADDKKKYILDFKKMQEYAEDDDEDVVNVIRRDLFKEGASDTPASWGEFKGNLNVVNLANTDPEYQDIYQKFQATAGIQRQISQIHRVQNKTLWNQYHTKKKQLEGQNPPNTQNENFLWHGTAEDAVDSINAHGFNRSYCGKNATALGNGVYFAVQAAYSCGDTYSRPDSSGMKRMYYCRVLTGEYTTGQSGMRVPPAKPSGGNNAIYDSVVDNVNTPGMYIVFNDTQAYPEYLVTFSP